MKTTDLAQIVTFRLGDDLFAADINAVERVLRYQAPSPLPNVPDWIEGVIEYQGCVLPVIDLRARFGLPRVAQANETRILVINTGSEFVATTVDAVLDVSPVDSANVAPPPAIFRGLSAEYLRGIVRRGERLVIFLEVARLLTATERLTLEAAVAAASTSAPGGEATTGVSAAEAVLPRPGERPGVVKRG